MGLIASCLRTLVLLPRTRPHKCHPEGLNRIQLHMGGPTPNAVTTLPALAGICFD